MRIDVRQRYLGRGHEIEIALVRELEQVFFELGKLPGPNRELEFTMNGGDTSS